MSVSLHPQFLVDEQGERRSVLLSIDEYQAVMEELENMRDAQLLHELGETSGPEDFQDWEEAKAELRAAGKIK